MTDEKQKEKPKKKRRKKQNYFNNKLVEEMVLKYQAGNFQDEKLLVEIIKHLDKIILAIINKYHFYRFYEFDDLFQEARIACLTSLRKFDINKAKQKNKSVFSYFSNVVKRNLRFFTLNKNKKLYKETAVPDDYFSYHKNIEKEEKEIDKYINRMKFDELILMLKRELKNKRRFYNLVVILEKYVKEINGVDFDKRDFVRYGKSFGYTTEFIKKFFNYVYKYKKEILED